MGGQGPHVDHLDTVLTGMGKFKVTVLKSPSRDELLKAAYSFQSLVSSLKGSCVALLYYAGHVITDGTQVHLLPASLTTEDSSLDVAVKVRGCSLNDVLDSVTDAHAAIAVLEGTYEPMPGTQAELLIDLVPGRPNLLLWENVTKTCSPGPRLPASARGFPAGPRSFETLLRVSSRPRVP
jgi:hypothetical protein